MIDLDSVVSYWDEGSCGPDGDDYNMNWCRLSWYDENWPEGSCNEKVSTNLCSTDTATLLEFRQAHGKTWSSFVFQGCNYYFRAIYACPGIYLILSQY